MSKPEASSKDGAKTGADVAPTKQAEERERIRHELEEEIGRTTAGHKGQDCDQRSAEVTREKLDEVAKEADKRVAGRPLPD